MIKTLIPAILTATMLNTIVQNSTRASTTILNYENLIQEINYDQNDEIETATYYQVKEFTNNLDLQYATVKGKGYTYLKVDNINKTESLKTAFYFIVDYIDGENNSFTFTDLKINLRGYLNPNIQNPPIYEDYDFYYHTGTTNTTVESFIYGDSYSLIQLNALNSQGGWSAQNRSTVDTVGTNCELTQTNKKRYYKWEIPWTEIGIFDDSNNLIPQNISNALLSLSNVYTDCTTIYSWTIDVEYNYEVIDIPDLIFTMLGMPFAWISTAFNLTLFSGTPYAINVSRLFFEIIGTLILIVVLKKVLK